MNERNHAKTEKRNLRPYILGACFVWGLALGFFTYLKTSSYAEIHERDMQKQKQEAQNQKAKEPKKPIRKAEDLRTSTERKTPDMGSEPMPPIPEAAKKDEKIIPKQGFKKIPEMAMASLNVRLGLTGQSTYRPVKPVKLEKKPPTVDFRRKSEPKRTTPVNINEIEPPELEE